MGRRGMDYGAWLFHDFFDYVRIFVLNKGWNCSHIPFQCWYTPPSLQTQPPCRQPIGSFRLLYMSTPRDHVCIARGTQRSSSPGTPRARVSNSEIIYYVISIIAFIVSWLGPGQRPYPFCSRWRGLCWAGRALKRGAAENPPPSMRLIPRVDGWGIINTRRRRYSDVKTGSVSPKCPILPIWPPPLGSLLLTCSVPY